MSPIRAFTRTAATIAAAAALLASCATAPSGPALGFFVTSVGSGNGADLGGLAGADAHCQKLASAAGAGGRTWRAYLSTTADANTPAVHARNRIGNGPWYNSKGALIASDVAQLHGAGNNVAKASALTERGASVNGRGDTPNVHDILTGSREDGSAFAPGADSTCGNWTRSGEGAAMTGHHDRNGPTSDPWAVSWNSSHNTRACGQEALKSTGGAGLFYCFAAN